MSYHMLWSKSEQKKNAIPSIDTGYFNMLYGFGTLQEPRFEAAPRGLFYWAMITAVFALILTIAVPGQQPQKGQIDLPTAKECSDKSAEILSHYADILKSGGALSVQCIAIVPKTDGA